MMIFSNEQTRVPQSQSGWAEWFSRLVSAIIISVGMAILISWSFYYWLPDGAVKVFISIQPNEAMCFILAGIVLWIRCENTNKYISSLASLGAGFIFLIGSLT